MRAARRAAVREKLESIALLVVTTKDSVLGGKEEVLVQTQFFFCRNGRK